MKFKVGDKVKLKTFKELNSIFNLSESQERIIRNNQNKTFTINRTNDELVTLNKDIFKNGYSGIINKDALRLCNKKIKLREELFEL